MTPLRAASVGPRSAEQVERRFPALDGARAFAAFGVVVTHVAFNSGRSLDDGPFAPFMSRLDFGVTLFFLLSGFVIYRPFLAAALSGRPPPPTYRFLTRRLVRILPAYWLAVVVTLAVLSLRHPSPAGWWHYLLLLQTYDNNNLDSSLTQMWTLSVELSFYFLVPVVAMWTCRPQTSARIIRRNLVVIVGLFVLAVVAGIAAHLWTAIGVRSIIWLPANVDWFALGMLLALISVVGSRNRSREPAVAAWQAKVFGTARTLASATGTCWALAGLVFLFATLPLAGSRLLLVPNIWEWLMKHELYGICAILLLAPLTLAEPGQWAAVLEWRPIRFLGEISYGVYLWHLPLLLAIQQRLGYRTFGGHFWILLALTSASTVVEAAVSWWQLERPLMGLVSRRYSSASGSGPSTPSRTVGSTTATSTSA